MAKYKQSNGKYYRQATNGSWFQVNPGKDGYFHWKQPDGSSVRSQQKVTDYFKTNNKKEDPGFFKNWWNNTVDNFNHSMDRAKKANEKRAKKYAQRAATIDPYTGTPIFEMEDLELGAAAISGALDAAFSPITSTIQSIPGVEKLAPYLAYIDPAHTGSLFKKEFWTDPNYKYVEHTYDELGLPILTDISRLIPLTKGANVVSKAGSRVAPSLTKAVNTATKKTTDAIGKGVNYVFTPDGIRIGNYAYKPNLNVLSMGVPANFVKTRVGGTKPGLNLGYDPEQIVAKIKALDFDNPEGIAATQYPLLYYKYHQAGSPTRKAIDKILTDGPTARFDVNTIKPKKIPKGKSEMDYMLDPDEFAVIAAQTQDMLLPEGRIATPWLVGTVGSKQFARSNRPSFSYDKELAELQNLTNEIKTLKSKKSLNSTEKQKLITLENSRRNLENNILSQQSAFDQSFLSTGINNYQLPINGGSFSKYPSVTNNSKAATAKYGWRDMSQTRLQLLELKSNGIISQKAYDYAMQNLVDPLTDFYNTVLSQKSGEIKSNNAFVYKPEIGQHVRSGGDAKYTDIQYRNNNKGFTAEDYANLPEYNKLSNGLSVEETMNRLNRFFNGDLSSGVQNQFVIFKSPSAKRIVGKQLDRSSKISYSPFIPNMGIQKGVANDIFTLQKYTKTATKNGDLTQTPYLYILNNDPWPMISATGSNMVSFNKGGLIKK